MTEIEIVIVVRTFAYRPVDTARNISKYCEEQMNACPLGCKIFCKFEEKWTLEVVTRCLPWMFPLVQPRKIYLIQIKWRLIFAKWWECLETKRQHFSKVRKQASTGLRGEVLQQMRRQPKTRDGVGCDFGWRKGTRWKFIGYWFPIGKKNQILPRNGTNDVTLFPDRDCLLGWVYVCESLYRLFICSGPKFCKKSEISDFRRSKIGGPICKSMQVFETKTLGRIRWMKQSKQLSVTISDILSRSDEGTSKLSKKKDRKWCYFISHLQVFTCFKFVKSKSELRNFHPSIIAGASYKSIQVCE